MANTIQAIQVTQSNSGVAFDYSEHFNLLNNLVERIVIAVEQISDDVSVIKAQQIIMANQQTTMAQQLTKISDDVRVLKQRGEDERLGIVTRGVEWDAYGRYNKALIDMALDDTGAIEPEPILRNNYNRALGQG